MIKESDVKRADQRLRGKYPYLETEIYQLSINKYEIFLTNIFEISFISFHDISSDFDYSIKSVTDPVNLSDKKPEKFLRRVLPIDDKSISRNMEGITFTHDRMMNFLKSKFNDFDIKNMWVNFDKQSFIILLKYDDDNIKNALQAELDKLKFGFSFSVEKAKEENEAIKKLSTAEDHIFQIPAFNLQPIKLEFIKRDENLWFENIDKAYAGELTKNDIFFWEEEKTSCFVDLSVAPNIDLRNHLLMYDTIYLSTPIKGNENLLFNKNLTKEDFFYLISKNRIKIINTQPEERLDVEILKEAYDINPANVVSRRALALLSIIDLFEINQNFIFQNSEIKNEIQHFSRALSNNTMIDEREILEFFYWPVMALRQSFDAFRESGTWGYSHIGVNQLIQKQVSRATGKDLQLEFLAYSNNIHIANALNATYFPWIAYKPLGRIESHSFAFDSIMGHVLNFYKYSTKDKIKGFQKLEDKKLINPNFVSPIDIFKIDNYTSIEEFERQTSSKVVRNRLNVLFNRLSNMSIDERSLEIEKYNNEICEFNKKNRLKMHLKNGLYDLASLMLTGPFQILYSTLCSNTISQNITKDPKYKDLKAIVDNLNLYIDEQNGEISDIDILSQVDRVAKLTK